ncbi:MAG: hypothetical protein ACU84Q_04930 [Gammaproteobacteria bacterium]
MTGKETFTISREFGLSHGDFYRIFPRVWPQYEKRDALSVTLDLEPDGEVSIELSEQKYRRLATLKIPYMDIVFVFKGVDESQRVEFFEKFERSFQKGGG